MIELLTKKVLDGGSLDEEEALLLAKVSQKEELVEAAKALGINMYACEMAMHVLGLQKSDFIHEVKDVLGVATFLRLSAGGQTLFV